MFQEVYAANEARVSTPNSASELIGRVSNTPSTLPSSYSPVNNLPGNAATSAFPNVMQGSALGGSAASATNVIVPGPRAQPNAIIGDVAPSPVPGASNPPANIPTASANQVQPQRYQSVQPATPIASNPTPKLSLPPNTGLTAGVGAGLAVASVALGGDPYVAGGGLAGQIAGGIIGGTLGGPIGAFVGSAVGGVVGSVAGAKVSDYFKKPGASTSPPIDVQQPLSGVTPGGQYDIFVTRQSGETTRHSSNGSDIGAVIALVSSEYPTDAVAGINIIELSSGSGEPSPYVPQPLPGTPSNKPAGNPKLTPIAPSGLPGSGKSPTGVPTANPTGSATPVGNPALPQLKNPTLQPPTAPSKPGDPTKTGGTPTMPDKNTGVPGLNPSLIPGIAPFLVPLLNPFSPPNAVPTLTNPTTALTPTAPFGVTATPVKITPSIGTGVPSSRPSYEKEPTTTTGAPPTAKPDNCCKSQGDDLELIKKILGVKLFPSKLPLLTGDKDEVIANIPELVLYNTKNIDAVTGLFPMTIDALQASGKTNSLKLENISHAFQELFAMSLTMAQDCDAGVNIGARIATEVINTKVKATQGNELLQALIKWTGINIAPIPKKIKLNFTPSAAGVNNKLENQEMEGFLKPSERSYVGSECAEKDQLLPIINRALQNTEISRASVWHPIKPAGAKGDNFIGTATSRASKKASKAEDKLWNKLLDDLKKQGYEFDETGNEKKKTP